jgi:hypothetical protein
LAENSIDISFEHSCLTRLLQPALSGNSNMSLVCTLCPSSTEDTIKLLNFASSARKIVNDPVTGVTDGQSVFKAYKKQVEDLR